MITLIFKSGTEIAALHISNNKVLFSNNATNFQVRAGIENMKLSISGIDKEFPDLKDKSDEEKRKIASSRFNEKIKTMKDEREISMYLIKEMEVMGYKLLKIKREGFRDNGHI